MPPASFLRHLNAQHCNSQLPTFAPSGLTTTIGCPPCFFGITQSCIREADKTGSAEKLLSKKYPSRAGPQSPLASSSGTARRDRWGQGMAGGGVLRDWCCCSWCLFWIMPGWSPCHGGRRDDLGAVPWAIFSSCFWQRCQEGGSTHFESRKS